MEKLNSADKKILDLAGKSYGLVVRHEKLLVGDKEVLLILSDRYSGRCGLSAQLYLKINKTWKLFLLRNTDTCEIRAEVNEKDNAIILWSKEGERILSQPFNTLKM